MRAKRYTSSIRQAIAATGLCLLVLIALAVPSVSAINPLPLPEPKSSSYGLEATKRQPPPTEAASISTPSGGASFSTSPITVSGLCPAGLLVQVYNNGVMVGAIDCKNGSFSLQVSLFRGLNELTAIVYDNLDQAGPTSSIATVTYNDPAFAAFGSIMTLTSTYGRRAANPGVELKWPLQLTGGAGPYAFSIDWGDGTPNQLKSQAAAGEVNITHTYKRAGVYYVTAKVTDVNGVTAFIQLVAVANGKVGVTDTSAQTVKTVTQTKVMWLPVIVAFAMLFPTYIIGRRSQLISLHKKLEKSTANYKEL